MNRRSSTCFLLAAVVTLALNCAVNASQPVTAASGASSQLDAILASFPAQAGEEAAELYKKILDGGKETVKLLCSRAAPSSAGNDAAVRFALHGLVHHVARPGADKQRRLVAGALAEALDTAATDDVQDFLLEQLRFVADKSNIPGVSKFLLNAGTADRAVAVLTAIGAPPAERAMLDALPKADPVCTATLIQALGDLGSEACVKECANRLDSTNAAVQRAALYALSRSGSSRAGDLLAARRRNPPAGMEADAILAACLDHAERLTQKGEGKRAAALAEKMLGDKAAGGAAMRCRALAILGMTKDPSVLPVLIASLGETNRSVRSQAARQMAGLQGRRVTRDLTVAVRASQGDSRAALLDALSLRPDFKDVALLEEGLRSQDVPVRIASLDGLCHMGGADAAKALLAALEKADEQDRPAIVAAVKTLSGKEALAGVAAKLTSPSPTVRVTAVQTLMERRARDHSRTILQLTRDPEPEVSRAAFKALAVLAGDAEMSELIGSALASTNDAFRSSVSDTLAAAAPRFADRTTFARQLHAAYKDADVSRRLWILSLLPVFGGATALDTLTTASAASEARVRETAASALAAWPESAALPALLEIAGKGANDNSGVLALRGAVRLLRETDIPSNRRLEMYSQALKAASGADDTRLILSGLSDVPETGAIELVTPFLDREDVRQEAALAIARIACPKEGKAPDLPPNQAAALRKACELVADKELKKKFGDRLPKLKVDDERAGTAESQPSTTDNEGFVSLFNGRDLTGWIGDTKGYIPEDGKIVCRPGGNLYTENQYSNFAFRFEFKLTPGANNGLGIRTPPKGDAAYLGMELQILDDTADQYKNLQPYQYHGSIYGVVPSRRGHLKPLGEWNIQEVIADGPKIKITLNGAVIVDADLSQIQQTDKMHDLKKHPGLRNEKGHIGFLGHGSLVEFRNLRIKELGSSVPAAPEGFTALFNGQDLTGWKGLLAGPNDNPIKRAALSQEAREKAQAEADENMRAHWKADGGVLVFDGKGRSICTSRDYKDFEMLVDWKILSNGDSGVYLRGSPQVQIWDYTQHPEGSGGLFNNQKNPAKPGVCADNPIGEWNTFRIKMAGERVTVHLNGKLVVDDVVLENYWDRSQPIFPSGQIELQNHGNTLYFRNLCIKEP